MSAAQGLAVDSFVRQGFAVFPRFLEAEQIAPLRAACDRVLERQRAPGADDTTNIAYLTDARWHPDDDQDRLALLELIASPRIAALISRAVGAPSFHNTQYFMEPRTRSWTGSWHRDCQFLVETPDQEAAIRAASCGVHFRVALVDDDHLEYVPGSERRADTAQELAARWPAAGSPAPDALPGALRLALRAGDALLFHAWGIHRGRYLAGRARRTLDVIYDIGAPPPGCPAEAFAGPVPLAGLSPAAHAFFAAFNRRSRHGR